MKRFFFLIGYWLVHTAGVFPIALKSPKKKKEKKKKSFGSQKTPSTPWKCSRRGLFLGIGQIIVILYSTRMFAGHIDDWDIFNLDYKFLYEFGTRAMTVAKAVAIVCCVLTTVIRRREIEQLLNNVCSLYFNVFKSTDPPEMRKFAFLITDAILSIVINALAAVLPSYSTPGFLQNFFWQVPYMFTILFIEAISGVILIYLQSAVEGLNREIKSWFPRVAEFDWKNWEPVTSREENHQPENLRKNAKNFLAEFRSAYRSVARIVDLLNSVYGFLMLIIVIFMHTACLLAAYCCLIELGNLMNNFEEETHKRMIIFGCTSVWCFVRISMICHRYEIVIKEINVTIDYISSIDTSEIDHDSKIELLELLDEIDGGKIRFTASNIFSLNHSTLYSMLNTTITYIIIVIQHLSS